MIILISIIIHEMLHTAIIALGRPIHTYKHTYTTK